MWMENHQEKRGNRVVSQKLFEMIEGTLSIVALDKNCNGIRLKLNNRANLLSIELREGKTEAQHETESVLCNIETYGVWHAKTGQATDQGNLTLQRNTNQFEDSVSISIVNETILKASVTV